MVGISFDDFVRLSPDEFEAVCRAHASRSDDETRGQWERMRMLAAVSIQPHVRKSITPQKLIPLPWDRKPRKRKEEPGLTREERRERMERLREALENK